MSKSNSKPSHEVFAVTERNGQKSHWLKIGACWAHEDSKGFNLKLEALPLNGASIVIRVRSDKPQSAEITEGGAA